FEPPDSIVGRDLMTLATVLARRGRAVHVFSRRGFATDAAGVSIHVLGDCGGGELTAQAETFTQRACNALLALFGAGRRPVALLGCGWSAAPVVSLVRGLRRCDAVLSFHSFERQRSGLDSDLSRRIDEIETAALREAKTVLVHDDAAETRAIE